MFNNPELNKIFNDIEKSQIKEDNKCRICMEEMLFGITVLSCKHKFHTECLKNSFNKYETKSCPYCRSYINWNSFKKNCNVKKTNGEKCEKICYSDDFCCNYHSKLKLKKYIKNIKLNSKSLASMKKKLQKYEKDNVKLNLSINNLKLKINKFVDNLVKKIFKKENTYNEIKILKKNILELTNII